MNLVPKRHLGFAMPAWACALLLVACLAPATLFNPQKPMALDVLGPAGAWPGDQEAADPVLALYRDTMLRTLNDRFGHPFDLQAGPKGSRLRVVLESVDVPRPESKNRILLERLGEAMAGGVLYVATRGAAREDDSGGRNEEALRRVRELGRRRQLLKRLNYVPYLVAGRVEFEDQGYRYQSHFDAQDFLAYLTPLPAREGQDPGQAIRQEEARALAQLTLDRLTRTHGWERESPHGGRASW